MLKAGDLVKCLDTSQIGTVLDVLQLRSRTMVLVKWPNETMWTDSNDLEAIDSF